MSSFEPRLEGQAALVTGAGRGIGRAIALALAREGARVALTARSRDEIESAAEEVERGGGEALAVPADISREEEVTALFRKTVERFRQLDILINNAGVGAFGALEEVTAEDFDRVIATNLRGTFLSCREALRAMIPRRKGTIINIASVVGFKGYARQAAYTASKHGVMGLTRSLAAEAHPHGIRVSAVLPGGVDTAMAGQARPDLDRSVLLQPEDVAQAVLYLLSLSDRAAVDEIYLRRRASPPG